MSTPLRHFLITRAAHICASGSGGAALPVGGAAITPLPLWRCSRAACAFRLAPRAGNARGAIPAPRASVGRGSFAANAGARTFERFSVSPVEGAKRFRERRELPAGDGDPVTCGSAKLRRSVERAAAGQTYTTAYTHTHIHGCVRTAKTYVGCPGSQTPCCGTVKKPRPRHHERKRRRREQGQLAGREKAGPCSRAAAPLRGLRGTRGSEAGPRCRPGAPSNSRRR